MAKLHGHPKKLTLIALAIAAGTVAAIAIAANYHRFIEAWAHPRPGWLAIVAGASLLATLFYILSYRWLMHFDEGLALPIWRAARIVAAGFGPFVPAGGFDVDKRALLSLHDGEKHEVSRRVFAIGALEWTVLAPAACISAIVLIAGGDERPMASVLWPWALAVPAGFAIGFSVVGLIKRSSLDPDADGFRGGVARGACGAWMVLDLIRHPRHGWRTILAMTLYWGLDIAAFYAAERFVGLRPYIGEAVVAYATGYALTRRSMPLGGAGVTEALMTVSLHWVGQPVPSALAVVAVYRLFNFVFPAIPALLVHGRVAELMSAGPRTVPTRGMPAAHT